MIGVSRPQDTDDTARPAADATGLPDIGEIFGSLPFGMHITCGTDIVFSNERDVSPVQQNSDLVTKSFDFFVRGNAFTVDLTLDESEQRRREQSLIQRAYFDELTGLPNRRLIEQSIGSLIEAAGASFAVAFLDIDGFKHINDFYGHAVGDQLLIDVSRRISSALRPSDMVARLGGDEFLVLYSPVADTEDVLFTLGELAERISRPYCIDNNEIVSTASIGVSIYPRDGSTYSELQSNADRAMYRGKANGSGRIQIFDETIAHSVIEKTRMEQRLRLAIGDRRITCAYQPKVDVNSGEVYGVEVLMRWIDEDGLIQPPGEFITLALELGLLDELTFLLLEKTVRCIDRINESFGSNVSISINVAAKQAGNISFMRSLLSVIAATGFSGRFVLEITEEAFVAKSLFQECVLPLIRNIGARVSIDDFGIGYSSLSALADITADEVKIDRSFITNIHHRPRNQNVLKAIEALSHSLGMEIVVEGIETIEELTYLQTFTGIHHAQGYYFSKPILLEDISSGHQSGPRQPHAARSPIQIRA